MSEHKVEFRMVVPAHACFSAVWADEGDGRDLRGRTLQQFKASMRKELKNSVRELMEDSVPIRGALSLFVNVPFEAPAIEEEEEEI